MMKKLGDTGKKIKYIFNRKEILGFVGIFLLILFSSVVEAVGTYAVMPFVYILMDLKTPESGVLGRLYLILKGSDIYDFIIKLAIAISVYYIFKAIIKILLIVVQNKYTAYERARISTSLFSTITKAPLKYFTKMTTPEFQRLIIDDVKRLSNYVGALLLFLSDAFTFFALIVVMLIVNPMITLISGFGLGLLVYIINSKSMTVVSKEGKNVISISTEMMKWIQQFMGGVKSILLNCRQEYFVNKYTEQSSKFARTQSNYQVLSALPYQIIQGVSLSSVFIATAIFVRCGGSVAEALPALATFALAVMRMLPLISGMNSSLSTMKFNQHGLELVYNHLSDVESILANSKKDNLDALVMYDHTLNEGICVEDITFSFDGESTPLFKNVSLFIPANKSVAFIGATGEGKTTLADIILGLQQVLSGGVYADGHDIYSAKEWWATMVGYIPQSIYLCDDTIRNNVAFGIEEKDIDDAKVWEALKNAKIDEFVKKLPKQLDSLTGENGIRLSGGQRQRIGIARALYNDPTFLVLDEATSALDVDTETAIMDTINGLSGKKTILIIAHRLSTIEKCDIVYRIENGAITEEKLNYDKN